MTTTNPTRSIVDELEPLAITWRASQIPILKIDKARWLHTFVEEKKPQRILELGTAVGYSGTIMTRAAQEAPGISSTDSVSLLTIDSDAAALKIAEETFSTYNVNVQIIEDDATEALKDIVGLGLYESFDLIFIDHAKAKYLEALDYCIKLCHPGSIIVADNVKNPKCVAFVAAISSDPRLETSFIDIDDGLSVSILKKIDK